MTLTPKQVIEELAKTGRHVEARTLTDWRSRGLLPMLTDRGRGQGKGKGYFWTDNNILDRVALVADLPSWETDRTILALWFCGFEVSPEQMKEAWLKSIERVSRQFAKQDMNAPAEHATHFSYFEQLEDAFHNIAATFRRQKKAEGDAMSEFAYELAQLGLSFALANSISDDFEEEVENINYYMTNYKPPVAKYDYSFPAIDAEFVLSARKFANLFEIRKAVQTATSTQFRTAQFIWKTICRLIVLLSATEPSVKLGLTTTRRFQGTFGPLVLSFVLVALQSERQKALVRLFEVLATYADELEAAHKAGEWTDPEGLKRFLDEIHPIPWPTMETLWLEFWEGIDRPASQEK